MFIKMTFRKASDWLKELTFTPPTSLESFRVTVNGRVENCESSDFLTFKEKE